MGFTNKLVREVAIVDIFLFQDTKYTIMNNIRPCGLKFAHYRVNFVRRWNGMHRMPAVVMS